MNRVVENLKHRLVSTDISETSGWSNAAVCFNFIDMLTVDQATKIEIIPYTLQIGCILCITCQTDSLLL